MLAMPELSASASATKFGRPSLRVRRSCIPSRENARNVPKNSPDATGKDSQTRAAAAAAANTPSARFWLGDEATAGSGSLGVGAFVAVMLLSKHAARPA